MFVDLSNPNMLPRLFRPHPNLSDDVNRNLVQSEIEGGVTGFATGFLATSEDAEHLLLHPHLIRRDGSDFGSSIVLPSSSVDHDSRIDLGRFDAQGALHRSGNAPGISSPEIQHTNSHVPYPRNPGMSSVQRDGDGSSGVTQNALWTANFLLNHFEPSAPSPSACEPWPRLRKP